jgi:hypothetical protein
MKLRDVAPLALIALLGGCTSADWDNVLSFPGIGDGPTAQPESPPENQQTSQPWQPVDGSSGAVETATLPPPTDTTPPWTPVGTSSQPPLTTASPLVAPPRTASPRPVIRPPVVTAPVQPAPRMAAVAPAPVRVAPAPVRTAPPPVYAAPAPVRPAPQAVYAAPAPARPAPQPVYAAPAPARPAPQPVYAAPVQPQTMVAAAAPESSPAETAPGVDPWCLKVAQSATAEAASQGFDAATQRRRGETSYNQCLRYGH